MPFVSRQQQKWGNSPSGIKALGGQKNVDEWNRSTKGKNIPERIHHKARHVDGSGKVIHKVLKFK